MNKVRFRNCTGFRNSGFKLPIPRLFLFFWSLQYKVALAINCDHLFGHTYEKGGFMMFMICHTISFHLKIQCFAHRSPAPFAAKECFHTGIGPIPPRLPSTHSPLFFQFTAREWAAGNKRTAATGSYIGKLVNRRLREKAFSAILFCKISSCSKWFRHFSTGVLFSTHAMIE